jgi:hypothetical protein
MTYGAMNSPRSGRVMMKLVGLALAVGLGIGLFVALQSSRTIFELLNQNRAMRKAITNLTEQRQIGYAKVLAQESRDGQLYTRLLFVVTDPDNKNKRVVEREYEIKGDVVHFDALIVKFGPKVVMDGKDKAIYLWRRIYGESMAPEDGLPIEHPGQEPERYREFFKMLSLDERMMFWDEIWKLSNDPARLQAAGVQAVYGSAIYSQLRPGLIYIFNLDAGGAFYPETVPAL